MKKIVCLFLFIFFFPVFAEQTPKVWEQQTYTISTIASNYDDDNDYENFIGRLYIEDINVDVALYHSNDQEVVDRKDSAAYFTLSAAYDKPIIADHNTHAFGSLGKTKIGTIARIEKENGEIVYYKCVDIFKGHNIGNGITDWEGNSVVGKSDLMMYTCFDGWKNIWVVLWKEIHYVNGVDADEALDNFIEANKNLIEEMIQRLDTPSQDFDIDEEIELTFVPLSTLSVNKYS